MLFLLVLLSVGAVVPFKYHLVDYRLPSNLIPLHYTLNLVLEDDVFETDAFSGVSTINITTTDPTKTVIFHAKAMTITNVELKSGDQLLDITWGQIDTTTETVRVESTSELTPETQYLLSIAYTGKISRSALDGFYKSSYKFNDSTHYMVSTYFEPSKARQAFPCFDEPALKATFYITITYPQGYKALANTPIADEVEVPETRLRQATFATTPPMSTYLIAFVVSEFDCLQGGTDSGTYFEVCSKQNTTNRRTTALRATEDMLRIMKNYTNVDYFSSGIGKLTQMAMPNYPSGGMENWGLITYAEGFLLADDDSPVVNQQVVVLVAHEVAHQWFGDLVTLDWWSDVFLNEGFATYFQYYAPDEIYPEWELPQRFVLLRVQPTLEMDAYESSLPLSYYVETPNDILYRFDDIGYGKGACIVRMVRYFLGLDNFKAGLADYIAEKTFSTATPDILWKSFDKYAQSLPEPQRPPVPMVELMANWTYEAGYPVLTVAQEGDDVKISQKRYLEKGSSDTKWYVPVAYHLPEEASSATETKAWLTPAEDLVLKGVLANSGTIVVNNEQIGYYRVAYADNLLQKISQNLIGIDAISKAHIVDDLFSFAKTGLRNYSTVLDFVSFLKNEQEYYPWQAALNGFNHMLSRTGDESLRSSLKGYILSLVEPLYSQLSFTNDKPEDLVHTLKHELIRSWACFLENEDCLANSRKASKDVQESPDEELLTLYLEKTRDGSDLLDLYKTGIFALPIGPKRVDTIFDLLTRNYKNFAATSDSSSLIQQVVERFTNDEQVDRFRRFIRSGELGKNVMVAAREALGRAEDNLGVTKILEKELRNYFY